MSRWILVVVVAVVACSHDANPPAPVVTPSKCAQVADHVVSLMSASAKSPEQVDPFRTVIARRCNEDGWPVVAQDCLLATKQLGDGNACQQQLTEQQAKKFEDELAATLGAMTPPAKGGGGPEKKEAEEMQAPIEQTTISPPPPPGDPEKSNKSRNSKTLKSPKNSKPDPGAHSDPCEGGE
jgi:hypothetical protein